MTDEIKWTEEDVKTRIIRPILAKLGFNSSEIQCEVPVKIRFGRRLFRDSDGAEVVGARGRVEYLVSLPDEKNLILIEAKSDRGEIARKDIDQALSYSNAITPRPRITIVTNGKTWLVFDSNSGERIDNLKFEGYEVSLEDSERFYKAVRRLRTLTAVNLSDFCRWQVLEYMGTLTGGANPRSKKYIPELFHEHSEVATSIAEFLNSREEIFLLLGRSGDGKSNWMCHCALELLDKGWNVFFFRSSDIRNGIGKALADEIQAQLGSMYTPIDLLQRVSEFSARSVVFVDGLDEIDPIVSREITTRFLRQSCTAKLRLIASCKTIRWPLLQEVDEIPTVLSERIQSAGRVLPLPREWSRPDLEAVLRKYRAFYSCEAKLGQRTREAIKSSPYLMRVLFEQGEGTDRASYLSLDSKELYETLLQKARTRLMARVPNLEEILSTLAEAMVLQDAEFLELSSARKALGLGLMDSLPQALFEASILEMDYPPDSPAHVRFYFGPLRDFLVGFRVLRWHKVKLEELGEVAEKVEGSAILTDALELFYALADDPKKRSLDARVHHFCTEFLDVYSLRLEKDFPELKSRLVHKWQKGDELGVVGEIILAPLRLRMIGLQAIKPGEPKVLLVQWHSDHKDDHRAGSMRGGTGIGNENSASSTAARVMWSDIKSLIKKTALDESNCPLLLKEKALAFFAERFTSVLEEVPLTVSRSRYQILFNKAMRNERRLFYKAREESGLCEVQWTNGSKSTSYLPASPDEQLHMTMAAEEIASTGRIVQTPGFENSIRVEDCVLSNLASLVGMGVEALDEEPLFQWYATPFNGRSSSVLENVVRWLTDNLIPTYESLVRLNFPNHWKQFPFAAEPRQIVLYIEQGVDRSWLHRWCFRSKGSSTTLELVDTMEGLPTSPPFPPDLLAHSVDCDILPTSYSSSRPGDSLNRNFFILHRLVYDQLSLDLKKTVKEYADIQQMSDREVAWL